jgi:arylsulfatase
VLPPRNDAIMPWSSLDAEQRRIEARKMELNAAKVENLDHHIGRLIDRLKQRGVYDNTLIVFMSDNGAAGSEDFYNTGPFVEYIRAHYDNSYENMGRPTSWVSYGPQWAQAGAAGFSRYKMYTREGGIAAQMIIAGPHVAQRGSISRAYATVMDLAPTFIQLAGATYPDERPVRPMEGESMAPLLAGEAAVVHDADYVTTLFHAGRAFVRRGPWKLVTLDPPFDEAAFELFNVEDDPGETTNLADTRPDIHSQLIALWRSERARLGIVLPQEIR